MIEDAMKEIKQRGIVCAVDRVVKILRQNNTVEVEKCSGEIVIDINGSRVFEGAYTNAFWFLKGFYYAQAGE